MNAQAVIRKALRRRGVHAWFTPPRGADLFADLKTLPLDIRTVLDVGANVGQSATIYLDEFPRATVHCFEPMPATFKELSANVGSNPRVRIHCVALSSEPGEARMDPTDRSETAIISDAGTVPVKVDTLDNLGFEHIDFLKIDAEGHDLEVLKGASRMLAEQRIDVVQVEVGMSPRHHMHVRFEDVKAFLEANRMDLFSLIDQTRNFIPGGPYLQRADAVFISNRISEL